MLKIMIMIYNVFDNFNFLAIHDTQGEYARTRASDSKHLPAVILNFFSSSEYNYIILLCLISLYTLIKISFTIVLYEEKKL